MTSIKSVDLLYIFKNTFSTLLLEFKITLFHVMRTLICNHELLTPLIMKGKCSRPKLAVL